MWTICTSSAPSHAGPLPASGLPARRAAHVPVRSLQERKLTVEAALASPSNSERENAWRARTYYRCTARGAETSYLPFGTLGFWRLPQENLSRRRRHDRRTRGNAFPNLSVGVAQGPRWRPRRRGRLRRRRATCLRLDSSPTRVRVSLGGVDLRRPLGGLPAAEAPWALASSRVAAVCSSVYSAPRTCVTWRSARW